MRGLDFTPRAGMPGKPGWGGTARSRWDRRLRAVVVAAFAVGWLVTVPSVVRQVAAAGDPVIAAAGDIACDPANTSFNGGDGTTANCAEKATSNLLVGQGLAAVLALGDNQYYCGSAAAFGASYDPTWGRVKSITHPVVGNHEYLTAPGTTAATGCDSSNAAAAGYFAYFGSAAGTLGQGYYSYDIGTWHLIALNSNCPDAGGCGATSPQGMWLAADLAAHPNQCLLAYWHIPLFSSGGRASPNSQQLWNALYAAHADVVLDGHDHIYERFAPQSPTGVLDSANGIRQFTVGTGGADHTFITSPAANSEVSDATSYGILKMTLHPGGYDWAFQPATGSFTDSGSASCHNPAPTVNAALDHLVLTPSSATVDPGVGQTYTATGFDAGGHSLGDVTSATTFTISAGTCTAALCTSTLAGDHSVTGTDISATGTATLHVTAASLHHLILSPASATIAAGGSQTYAAAGFDAYGNSLGNVTSATTLSIVGGSCTGASCTSTTAGDHTVTGTDGSAHGTATLTVTGVQGVISGSTYHAIAPTRVLDTRNGTGGLSGPFSNHAARTFTVSGLPSNATAVTGNLTVTGQTSSGYLYIGPVATNNPGSSTLNFPAGDDRANAVTVALGAGSTLSITFVAPSNGPMAQAIFDVTGYFTPDTTGATYHAISPTRALDTRSGTGGLSGPFTNHAARTFTVAGVPSGATAVTGNLTVTGQTSGGYLYIGPTAANNPTSSTLNFPVGDDRANAVTVQLGSSDTLSITFVGPINGQSAQAIFDVTGYFTADMTGAVYVPLAPTRLLDTRNGTGGLSGPFTNHAARTFTLAGSGGVLAGATAVTGNLTVTGQTSGGYLFISPTATNNPTSSTLNFPLGDDRANAVAVQLGAGGTLSITFVAPSNGPTAQAIFDVTGYFVP